MEPPLRVHIAELVIATHPAEADVTIADSITERAEAKGLAVVARDVVGDVEELIRAKLKQFIGNPEIDVVIATGVAESVAAHNALKPLITSPVPGFTDLFRWLAYQEIGASAMLSNAEAAQCTSTFVFLLPAVKGAVAEAMDKLILPQLDPKTQPKNLIQQIPRLASLVVAPPRPLLPDPPLVAEDKAAVPLRIEAERTESGPGISARLPSNPVVPIHRPAGKTGPHVIRKADPDVTKQIDRAELERNLERSETNANDAVTKPSLDIRSLLPKRPPGADADDDESDADEILSSPPPVVRARPPTQRTMKRPPTIQIPVKEGSQEPALARTPPALTRKTPARGGVVSLADLAKSVELDAEPLTAPLRATAAKSRRESTEAEPLDATELEPATDDDFNKAVAADTRRATTPPPVPAADAEVKKPRRTPTEPPPPPKKHAPTASPALPESIEPPVLSVPDKKVVARPVRTPTEPPPPRVAAEDDLPRGKFVYPTHKGLTSTQIATWGLFALLAAAAGIAFVHFFLTKEPVAVAVIADAPMVAAVPTDAEEAMAAIEPDAAIPEIEIDVRAAALGSAAKHDPNPGRPVAKPRDAGVASETGSGGSASTGSASTGSGTTAVVPPEDPTCDEVSCVLEKYARPCCARYKPADTFKPAIPGQVESLDKIMVREGIEGVKPRVIACGEKFPTKGTVKIAMSVTADGAVKNTSVADSPNPELGTCVAQALRAATFAKTAKGGTFTYPFVF